MRSRLEQSYEIYRVRGGSLQRPGEEIRCFNTWIVQNAFRKVSRGRCSAPLRVLFSLFMCCPALPQVKHLAELFDSREITLCASNGISAIEENKDRSPRNGVARWMRVSCETDVFSTTLLQYARAL